MFLWTITLTNNKRKWKISVYRNSIDEALEWAKGYKGDNWIIAIERIEE